MSEKITKSIILKADVSQAYHAWENFENFPKFMKYIKSVRNTGPNTSHWEMSGPLGVTVEWDAEMTRNDENKRIAWNTKDRSKENGGNDLTTSGQVTFNALPQGETEVTVIMVYDLNAGRSGKVMASLFSHPEKQLETDLRNFKAFVEGMYDRTAT